MATDDRTKAIVQRFRGVESMRRGGWDTNYQEIADNIIGRRNFTTTGNPNLRRDVAIYDTTGRSMVNLLAGGLHSLLVNPVAPWFLMKTSDVELMEDYDVQAWLQAVERVLYGIFQDPAARFTPANDEMFLDLVSFGTGSELIADIPGRQVLFTAAPLSQMFPCENEFGEIDTVYRVIPMTARQIVRKFRDKAPEKAQQIVAQGKGEERLDILHCVYPADDEEPGYLGFGGRMGFISRYIFLDTQEPISTGGVHEQPYLVARWRVDSGESMGRGPCHDSLADCKMASAMKLTTLQAGQMGVAPPFITEDDSVLPQLDLRPFGRNIVRSGGGGLLNPPIQALDFKPQALIGVELLRDVRQQIQEAFHFELLKLIQNQGLTPMTAEQVATIRGAVERLLAPILGRQNCDFHGPLINRVYGIALRRGLIPDPPPILSGRPLKVEYVSPITRAARQGEVIAVEKWIARLAQAAQFDPSVMDNADLDAAARFLAEQDGVPAQVVRSPADVRRRREADRKLAAEQDQMEQVQQGAEAIGKVAPALQQIQQAGA